MPDKRDWETGVFREAKDASSQFVKAYVPLILEADQVAILEQCQAMHDAWEMYLEQLNKPGEALFDRVKFNNAYHALTQELRNRKSALESIP